MIRARGWLPSIRLFLVLVVAGVAVYAQAPESATELGSRTAKAGFANETEIAGKFNNWRGDEDARVWLAAMNYTLADIESVAAAKLHGEKADVQVRIKTKSGEFREGISIKLVSNQTGFNQIDKRWLATYAKMWKMPVDVVDGLKFFLGETKPGKPSRKPQRMFLNELDVETQKKIVGFFSANKGIIVSDIFEGDGPFAAKWFLVALKNTVKPRWVIRSSSIAAQYFSAGNVSITRGGNLRIGRITMQRKGGDGGRETAKMLQFKINPVLLLDAK